MQLPTIKFLLFSPKIHPTLLLHFLFLFLFLFFFFLLFFLKNQSMAVMGYYSSTQIMVRESCPIKRPVGRIMVTLKHNSQVSVIKIPAIEIRTSFRNKVLYFFLLSIQFLKHPYLDFAKNLRLRELIELETGF